MSQPKCPVCHTTPGPFVESGGRHFLRCPQCHYIFAAPGEQRLSGEDEKRFFRGQWEQAPEGGNPACYPAILSLASTCGISPLMALDFGCGNGGLMRLLRANGIPAYGVDRVAVENDMLPFAFTGMDALPPLKFGMITAIEVFEHLPDPVAVLELLLERLSEDGFLFITTALTNRSMAHLKFFPYWVYQRDLTHIGFFAENTFAHLAAQYGLELQVFGYGDLMLSRSKKRLVVPQEGRLVFHLQDAWDVRL